MTTPHYIVLAGDSIFDNDSYVLGEPGVIEQLRKSIPTGWSATKVAVDGDCIKHVAHQVEAFPTHATDLIVSVGGNDARKYSGLLSQLRGPMDLERVLKGPIAAFGAEYASMLDELLTLPANLHVCTIYSAIPFEDPLWRQMAPLAIGGFNTVITSEADKRGIPVLRIDQVCIEPDDFSPVSPIEPSCKGGQKIVDLIVTRLRHHNL